MDPVTAGLNFGVAFLELLRAIVEKLPPDAAAEIVKRHEERIDRISAFFDKHAN